MTLLGVMGVVGASLSGLLTDRQDEIAAALVALRHDHLAEPHRSWLREQYRLVVPVVLPEALRAVEDGRALSPACLGRVRAMAAGCRQEQVPLAVCLRAGLPAVGVVAVIAQRTAGTVQGMHLVHRAGAVAQELGSTWVEAWTATGGSSAVAPGVRTDDARAQEVAGGAAEIDPVDEQLVSLVALGRSNVEIAEQIHYSRQAVGWRLSRLMRRWRASNRAALVTAAFHAGVLRAPRELQHGGDQQRAPGDGTGRPS